MCAGLSVHELTIPQSVGYHQERFWPPNPELVLPELSRLLSHVVCLFSQRGPSDYAVLKREQSAPDTSHSAGGDDSVSEHSGQYRELRGRHQQRPLGYCSTSHPVPQAARQDLDRPLRTGMVWIKFWLTGPEDAGILSSSGIIRGGEGLFVYNEKCWQ